MKNLIALALTVISLGLVSCHNDTRELRMIVGTYTDNGSEGIYSYAFDQKTGEVRVLDSCRIENPSYLVPSADGRHIYAVSEMHNDEAAIVALNFDPASGSFEIIGSRKTRGVDPCYVATDGKIVTTANYGGSMSVFPVMPDGNVGEMTLFYEGNTGGPDSIRQCEPHVHCTEFAPDNRHLYVSDFSADRILVFSTDDKGLVELAATAEVAADCGPRHIIFDQAGKHAYVIGELSGFITVLDVDSDSGEMTVKQTVDADPGNARSAADIHLSPDGRFLYASVRQPSDCITIYSVDSETGELTGTGSMKTGHHPRNFNITPDGGFLLCACRDSNRIDVYRIDSATGMLTDTGNSIPLPHPVCVKFVRPADY